MNKARRKWLEDIIGKLEEQKDELYQLYEEEQEAYDNMPESLQESERGQIASEFVDSLETEHDSLEDVITNLQEILER
jgi:exonuclease VII small subunit